MEYDLGIIGSGPAGQKAAVCASDNGFKVIVFEKNAFGGCCLNLGCIPTKTILHDSLNKDFNWKNTLKRKDDILNKFTSAIEKDFKNRKIEVVKKEAEIKNGQILADGIFYNCKNILIATGSKPFELSNMPFDHEFILSSDDLLKLEEMPKSIVIIGSGAIGIEWARIFSNLNVEVTVIEAASNLLPNCDISISKRIERIFKMQKIKFYTNVKVEKLEDKKIILSNRIAIEADKILVAVGRKKVMPESDVEIKINHDLTTNMKNIFIAGDASNYPMLAHSASFQAKCITDKITKNKEIEINPLDIPSVIYGSPEIASVGLREQDIQGDESYKIQNLPLGFLPKAWCDNNIDGFIKIITKDNEIKGVHIISPEASSLISSFLIAMKCGIKKDKIQEIIFPHPTYSEGILEVLK